jgi:hypothetical protein
MYRRPASVSILVGFLSIISAVSILFFLRTVFVTGDVGAPGDAPAIPPAAMADTGDTTDTGITADTAEGPWIPRSAMPIIGLVFSVISFVCAVNILDGANWARWLFTVTSLLFFACDLIVYSHHFLPYLPSTAYRLVVIIVLFLPTANDFFKHPD